MKDLSVRSQQYYSNISIYYLCSRNKPPQKNVRQEIFNPFIFILKTEKLIHNYSTLPLSTFNLHF